MTPAGKALHEFRKAPREVREVAPGFLWIDAEDFADYGGWWIDTQYVAFMGSAYLIAAGVCEPVKDAVTTVSVSQPGRYRLWARTKNWHPQCSPGRFKVALNGQASPREFGSGGKRDWVWESGGEFDLPAGPARLALQDLTGAYGRCDALILTTDLQYQPPEGVPMIAQERSRLTGLSLEPRDAGDYDVVVVGAGTAGCCAAISAARLGARTILIQDRPVLGGNASIEMGVPPQGASVSKPNARESGIMEEALRITVARDFTMVSDAFTELTRAEKNLTVMLNERVNAVDMAAPGCIGGVRMVNTLDGRLSRARGKLFIDCTGDGWVGFFAGAEYRLGRESKAETGEELAVDKSDNVTMSGCILGPHSMFFHATEQKKPVPFTPPVWAAQLPPPEEFGRRITSASSGNWWLEHEGTVDDLNDPEFARDELIRIVFGYWDFLKNRWPERARSAHYQLDHVPIWNARRETRRLMGDHVLTQQDVLNATVFPDRISYGGWSMDIHHPRGIFSGKEGPYNFDTRTPLYTIPYRCLYSRNVSNLLFAGRDCSVTHVALGTVRVESTLATLGQAAGAAAGLCARHGAMPRDIYASHITELQQVLLRQDQYIPDLRNEDPADLARAAKAAASSTATRETFSREDVAIGGRNSQDREHEMTTSRAVLLPTGLEPRVDAVWLCLKSTLKNPVPVTATLRGAASVEKFAGESKELGAASAQVAPGQHWVKFAFRVNVPQPVLGICLPATPGLSWLLMKSAPLDSGRAYGGGGKRLWTVLSGQFYAAATEPARAYAVAAQPEKVVDGVARIVGRELHLWSSDPAQPLPQWLELDLGSAKELGSVELTFDTDMNARWPAKPLAKQCVRDYDLLCDDGAGGWKTLCSVKDNFQRHRRHTFPAVNARKIRIQVLATHGAPAARIFEVRIYDPAHAP